MLFILRKNRAQFSADLESDQAFASSSSSKRCRIKLSSEREQFGFISTMKAFFVLLLLLIPAFANAKNSDDVTELQIGVKYKPEKCSIQAHKGDMVKVHYKGSLTDGTVFDSSHESGDPIEFELGAGHVIQGWEQGLLGMCLGEKRKLKIPAKLGYGEHGSPPTIPGGATLIFNTELVGVAPKSSSSEMEEEDNDEL